MPVAGSREALGVKGEASYPVPSLSLPDIKHLPVIEQLSQYEAVRLFIDRVLLVSPHFVVDKDSAPHIAQICYRLDGIPLAIELAAARVKMMSVDQISKRLDDRFRLLTGGARTALPRQQTLRALIDWSYDHLSENEQLLLRRLAVFAGGWTLEAAEAVCSWPLAVGSEGRSQLPTANRQSPTDVLDTLDSLVDRSLVLVDEVAGGLRYRMLETVREYARGQLAASGEQAQIERWHWEWHLQLAERGRAAADLPEQREWLLRLERELDGQREHLDGLERRVAELEERLDFTERLLAERNQVAPGTV